MIPGAPPVHVKRLRAEAKLPIYGSAGAGAFDVCASIEPTEHAKALGVPSMVTIPAGGHHLFGTGLSFAVPEHFLMVMNVRSGLGAKFGLRIRNTVGYIDHDYRGELLICLENTGSHGYTVSDGERIAQCAVVLAPQFEIVEVDDLPTTARGAGGFGSTGA